MRTVIYRCNVCDAERKEANHWWLLIEGHKRAAGVLYPRLEVMQWCDTMAEKKTVRVTHLCGRACVDKAMARFMDGCEKA